MANSTFIVQHLAGLPETLTELRLPALVNPKVDIYRLLPPNITKLHEVGGTSVTCYPSSHHSLDSLEHLALVIRRVVLHH